MAEKPYKIYDRRGSVVSGGNNRLIPAATPNYDRKLVPDLGYDTHRNITALGLRKLRDVGKFLFWRFPLLHGAVMEKAEMSVGSMIRQFAGEDKAWGELAGEILYDSDENFSVRGWPYDNESYRINQVICNDTEGGSFTLLTETPDGSPRVQVIPTHRIGGYGFSATVGTSDPFRPPTIYDARSKTWKQYEGDSNPWAGYKIEVGGILNEVGAVVAWRVYDDPPTSFVDISANSLFPSFIPITEDQIIGIPGLSVSAFDWQDVQETRAFEMLAQKAGASIALVEYNESGGSDAPGAASQGFINTGSGDKTATPTGLINEMIDGGTVRYLKANTGAKLEALKNDRPTMNQQAFEDRVLDGCFHGIGWSRLFTVDPRSLSGGPARIIVDKINRTRQKNQRMSEKAQRRIDAFKISKFIKNGELPPNKEALKWEYQWSARVTADQKYEDEIMRERIKMGGGTYHEWYGSRNLDSRQQIKQLIGEVKFFQDECALAGVEVETVRLLASQQLQPVQGAQDQQAA